MHLLESPILEQSEPAFLLICIHQDVLNVLNADHALLTPLHKNPLPANNSCTGTNIDGGLNR